MTGGLTSWRPGLCAVAGALAASLAMGVAPAAATVARSAEDLLGLSIEDLAQIDVTSVSKTSQPLSDAPAAIYVITHEEAVRSGAVNLAEMLRLAPNLQVARITASTYAISARGFNGTASDKLLVLIDGRGVYTPFANGVLWDAQDMPAELIERIEVVSGPGATLWGANAVNGVINVITRKAADSQGGGLDLGAGDRVRRSGLWYGSRLGEGLAYRLYASANDYESGRTGTGADAKDGWRKWQTGFRLDWTPGDDLVTLQGDGYRGVEKELTTAHQDIAGYNLLARWTHALGEGGVLQAQAYYDDVERSIGPYKAWIHTTDLDLQHSFTWGQAQQIVWGGGYRVSEDHLPVVPQPGLAQAFTPIGRTLNFGNIFAQDTIALTPALKLTLGLKIENDPYSELQSLPSVRASWKVTDSTLIWAAASRAVRAPSRLDRDFVESRGAVVINTGRAFRPEKLTAYEVGYRAQPWARGSVSVSAFYNVYDNLRSFEFTNGGLPVVFANQLEGETYGVEAWGAYQVVDWWRLSGGANWLRKDLRFKPGSARLGGVGIAGDDPDFQVSLRSAMQLRPSVSLDLDLRHVAALPGPISPSYVELGAQVRWAVSRSVEIDLVGANLLHRQHLEFGSAPAPFQIGATGVETARSIFVDTRWRF